MPRVLSPIVAYGGVKKVKELLAPFAGQKAKASSVYWLAQHLARERGINLPKGRRRALHHILTLIDRGEFRAAANDPAPSNRASFYASWEWRTLRMKVLQQHGHRCQCCGATPDQKTVAGERVRLVVDHIKPLARHWSLRLNPDNLQVLCDECNMGKGAWDETDYRRTA